MASFITWQFSEPVNSKYPSRLTPFSIILTFKIFFELQNERVSCKFTDQSESFRLGTKALIGQEGCGEKSLVQSSELDFTDLRSTLLITWRSTFPLLILGLNEFLVIGIFSGFSKNPRYFFFESRDFFFWFWAPFWAHLFYFAKIRNSYAAADGIWFERKLLTTWDPEYSGRPVFQTAFKFRRK